MVLEQIEGRGIHDHRVLDCMRRVPRHLFVPERYLNQAYDDLPLPIGLSQTISQPYMVGLMTARLELTGSEKILEIGTGSGYQTAILAALANRVYSVERHELLAQQAQQILKRLHYENVSIHVGDGSYGWLEFAPYDGILVTAGAPEIPAQLIDQLNEGGRLVIPIGDAQRQHLVVARKQAHTIEQRIECGCIFVPLVGAAGWVNE